MDNYFDNKNKQSLIMTTLKSLYLALISSLKTLSSNNTTLLITFLVAFIVLYILSLRIIVLPCVNCSKGAWWFKCAPDTGYGTKTCRWYDDIVSKTTDFVKYALRYKYNLYNTYYTMLEHQYQFLNQYFIWLDDMFYAVLNLNPITAFMLFIYNAIVPPMMRAFADMFGSIEDADISFTLPVINVKLDIGALIIAALKGILWFIKFIFTLLMDFFFLLASAIYEYIFKPMFSGLLYLISEFVNTLDGLLSKIGLGFDDLGWAISQPFVFLGKLGIHDIILLIFEGIINSIMSVLSISKEFIEIFPTIIIICIVLYIIFVFIVPILGAVFCFGRLIKAFIYLILSCDDDQDFALIFIDLFNSIFKTNI